MHDLREFETNADDLVRALLSLDSSRRLSMLDSCDVNGARLLIAGFDPFEVIEVRDGLARIFHQKSDKAQEVYLDALAVLDERLEKYRSSSQVERGFPSAACIATFSYELAHRLERLRSTAAIRHEDREPDAVYAFYDTLVVHDYQSAKTFICSDGGVSRIVETEQALRRARPDPWQEVSATTIVVSNMTRDEYLVAVDRIKDHISAGDIYQANLTQRFTCSLPEELKPDNVFVRLRRDHPAPFAAFIRRRDDVVVSISPERFLRVDAGQGARQVEAQPIKGTRPRGQNSADDAELRLELQTSEKDRAENVMIVDLLRNDLGRVCVYGSVKVDELCRVEQHPTLFHLVSTVRGTLRDEVTAGDLIRACFPCGSITGAPKIRSMEIIDDVETVPRGLSMGAIGYFGFDGSIDLNVAIRTMTISNGTASFNVGGGIVADSSPAEEYEESLIKARALFRALGVGELSGNATSQP